MLDRHCGDAPQASRRRAARGRGLLPVMETIAPDVWQVHGKDFRIPGGIILPLSSTVIRLPDRTLVVYSPLPFDDATAAAIEAEGEVAHLVAPSRLHHLYAAAAKARWPRATLHAAPGVKDKQPDLTIDRELGRETGAPFGDAIEAELVGGVPKINEVVLFHRPSGTLVCADLVFHFERLANFRTRLVLAVMGVGAGGLSQSREWGFARKDKAAARASAARILAWPIARVAPCHGRAVEIDAAGLAGHLVRLCGGRADT